MCMVQGVLSVKLSLTNCVSDLFFFQVFFHVFLVFETIPIIKWRKTLTLKSSVGNMNCELLF